MNILSRLLTVCLLLGVLIATGCASVPSADSALKGNWQYTRDETVIDLKLGGPDDCELRLSRFVTRDAGKKCRYELSPIQPKEGTEKSYLLFLKDAQGNCDLFADFEFMYDPQANLVTLIVQNTPFYMQKLPKK